MYIRRKVFSVVTDEYGEERYFSTTEFVNEDSYLDELMYSDDDSEAALAGAAKAGLTAGLLAGGGYGAFKGADYIANKRSAKRAKDFEAAVKKVMESDDVKKAAENRANVKKARKAVSAALDNPDLVAEPGNLIEERAAKDFEAAARKQSAEIEKARRAVATSGKKGVKIKDAGRIERYAAKVSKYGKRAGEWASSHKGASAGIGAGILATGAGINYATRKK